MIIHTIIHTAIYFIGWLAIASAVVVAVIAVVDAEHPKIDWPPESDSGNYWILDGMNRLDLLALREECGRRLAEAPKEGGVDVKASSKGGDQ